MNPVVVRNVRIGEGIPKICIPILGVTREDIINEAKAFESVPADLAEWRADWYEDAFDIKQVKKTLKELRAILKDAPILFTFRTSGEGGEKSIEPEAYAKLNKAVAESGDADLLDVEIFSGDEIVKDIIETAHGHGVKIVASSHDFDKTPDKEEIVARLRRMQELGADIPKIAVMPRSKEDVLTLLSATQEMSGKYADRPIITMSMAGLGAISRLCGEVFGSALTFGSAKKASAPGQMDANDLAEALYLIHKSLSPTGTLQSPQDAV